MVPPVQGVAHHLLPEDDIVSLASVVLGGSVEERATVADVPHNPVTGRGREEREGEVGGQSNSSGCRCGGVRRGCGVEDSAFGVEQAEHGRGVELAVLSGEGAVGGDAAEGDTGSGGAYEVRWGGQPEEDFRQDLVGDRQRLHFQVPRISCQSGELVGGGRHSHGGGELPEYARARDVL